MALEKQHVRNLVNDRGEAFWRASEDELRVDEQERREWVDRRAIILAQQAVQRRAVLLRAQAAERNGASDMYDMETDEMVETGEPMGKREIVEMAVGMEVAENEEAGKQKGVLEMYDMETGERMWDCPPIELDEDMDKDEKKAGNIVVVGPEGGDFEGEWEINWDV